MKTAIYALVALGLAAAPWLPAVAQLQQETCFGRKATIVGTDRNDRLVGTPGNDVIVAGEKNDRVYGRGGRDRICGGAQGDFLFGGPGRDLIDAGNGEIGASYGGRGADYLTDGENGFSDEYGGRGDDRIVGEGTMVGGRGDDLFRRGSGPGYPSVNYLNAPGPITADLEAGTVSGDGHDRLDGVSVLSGSEFDDKIRAPASPVTSIFGAAGDDVIELFGPPFEGSLPTVNGGTGADRITGSDADEGLSGGDGHDIVRGLGGNDALLGYRGNDRLLGGLGLDGADGGRGRDLCRSIERWQDRCEDE